MGVVFAILLVGLTMMQIRFSILLAIAIAFLDFLPFFGTGTALIPWAIYKFLVGDYKMVAALVILYGVTQLVRQLIQPKLVGDSMGLNPLYTLFLLYLGYRVGSVLGMIFAVPSGLILLNLYQAGAFDAVSDGQFNLTPNATAKKAAQDALNGWDPTYGAIYYFNPKTATSAWIWSRPMTVTIGNHRFCK